MNKPWDLYDALIDLVPSNLKIRQVMAGPLWTLATSGPAESAGVGLAMSQYEDDPAPGSLGLREGLSARDAAVLIRSWDFQEAAVGLAVINSWLNHPANLAGSLGPAAAAPQAQSFFHGIADRLAGLKVATIGHFRDTGRLAEVCELAILERRPSPGDFPDPACEYLLPDMDAVLISASALINKTMPRLLELCRHAYVAIVGPSTPLTPVWFRWGVSTLAGTVVDPACEPSRLGGAEAAAGFFASFTRQLQVERGQATDCSQPLRQKLVGANDFEGLQSLLS